MAEKLDLSKSKSSNIDVLEVHNLKVNYGDKDIFKNVSFNIKPGERVWLCGKNGSGKSSIIKLIMGENIFHDGYIKTVENISYICQDTSHLNGNLNDFAKSLNIDVESIKRTLVKLGLNNIQFEKDINEWSEGQK
ncbi:MAG TPA: Lsa family ABC-F type ribosomal protection protein, partial [Terrisporobacter glycolicus]|nr:Lsa family ABC-F type ribosomal protection protein [Terrisporobacter hibernicus]